MGHKRFLLTVFSSLAIVMNSCNYSIAPRSYINVYHIDPSCPEDNFQDGSIAHPFRSWVEITKRHLWKSNAKYLQKCGTVYKKTLFLTGLVNGTSKHPIIISSYGSGRRPMIIANGLYAISIRDCSHWVIQNFDLSGASSNTLQIYAQKDNMENIKILNCHIDGASLNKETGRHCVQLRNKKGAQDNYHINNIEIAYNLIENAGDTNLNCDGIYLGAVKSNALIHHNIIRNNSGNGIDIAGGTDHIAAYNKLVNNAGTKAHGQSYPLNNVTIKYNLVIQHTSLYTSSFGLSLQDSFNGKLYNNTVYLNNRGIGAFILSSPVNPSAFSNNIIINNIFYGSQKGTGTLRVLPELIDRIDNYGNIMDNNIISNQSKAYYIIEHKKPGRENNFRIRENAQQWVIKHPHDILTDICFTNPQKNDFTIDKKSMAFGMQPRKDIVSDQDMNQMGAPLSQVDQIVFSPVLD